MKNGSEASWIVDAPLRLDAFVAPVLSARSFCPCRLRVDLRELLVDAGVDGAVDLNSLFVVAHDLATGEPRVHDPSREGLGQYQVRSRLDCDGQTSCVSWVTRDDEHQHYSIYFDTLGDEPRPLVRGPGWLSRPPVGTESGACW